jgi:hypothetical protein
MIITEIKQVEYHFIIYISANRGVTKILGAFVYQLAKWCR